MIESLTYAAAVGIVLPVIAAVIMQTSWSATRKRWFVILTATAAVIIGVWFAYSPGAWLIAGPLVAMAIGVAQMVYTVTKPLLDKLETATNLPKRAQTEDPGE